jgi:hypothetical protein
MQLPTTMGWESMGTHALIVLMLLELRIKFQLVWKDYKERHKL